MSATSKRIFLFLIVFQALHSIEEYYFSLWEVFFPARYLSSLISSDLALGFAVINITIVAFGLWSYAIPVLRSSSYVSMIVWFWILLELANGIGHAWFSVSSQSYFPGLYTAPFLITLSSILAITIIRKQNAA